MTIDADLLPKRSRGRQSDAAILQYGERVAEFCNLILQIKSTMDFDVGSRGWCYILEHHGLRKGEFGAAEKLITDCRKSGPLPLDICAGRVRKVVGLQRLDDPDIEGEAASWIDYITNDVHKTYTPVSFWDNLDHYVEVAVEKLDLRNLFEAPCAERHVGSPHFIDLASDDRPIVRLGLGASNAMRREQAVRAHHPSHTPGTCANAREAQSRP